MNNKNDLLKPKSTLSDGKREPCRSMNSGPSPSLHRCLNPSDGSPEKAS